MSPRARRPHSVDRHPMVVVVVLWGDTVLDVHQVDRGRSLGLGDEAPGIVLPRAVLGARRQELITHRGGHPWLRLPRGARGSIASEAAAPVPLDELPAGGSPYRSTGRPQDLPLGLGIRVRLEVGAFTLLVSHTMVEVDVVPPLGSASRRRLVAVTTRAALLLLILLAVSSRSMPALGASPERPELPVERSYRLQLFVPHAPAVPEAGPPPLALSPEPTDSRLRVDAACRCGDVSMGTLETATKGRYGVAGPQDNPDPHPSRFRFADYGMATWWGFGREHHLAGDPYAPTAPWGRDDSLGTNPLSARGAMWGNAIADGPGAEGLGLASVDGGVAKVIESRADGAGASGPSPRVMHTGLRLLGPLGQADVLPVLAERFGRFVGCYARGLERDPELGGRVDLQLEIASDGSAEEVSVARSKGLGPRVTGCLASAVEGLTFPASSQGPSIATYPLICQPPSG